VATTRGTLTVSSPTATAILLCVLVLPPMAGCGGGTSKPAATTARPASAVCLPAARGAVARGLGRPPGSVSQSQSTGNNAQPQCSFRAGRTRVVVNVDSSPQPFNRLERAVVEDAQQFSVVRNEPPPQRVAHLGLDADWFPGEGQLLTADNRRLITVTLKWPGASPARKKALAAAVARVYLGR
jgi:hypothetical protein